MQFTKREMIMCAVFVLILLFVLLYKGNSTAMPSTNTQPTSAADAANNGNTEASLNEGGGTVAPTSKIPAPLTGRLAPELVRPTGFSNTDTLGLVNTNEFTLKQFIGKKIILLEFWTTSSLNSLHTIPYLNQWQREFGNQGLLVVTVHTPRFEFEKSKSNVDKTAHDTNMISPIVLDTQYETWTAYKNTVWPHLYVIDLTGHIVYDHAGEGAYAAADAKIQELLAARAKGLGVKFAPIPYAVPKDAYATNYTGSEVYVGAARNTMLANGTPIKEGQQSFEPVANPKSDMLYLTGSWNFTKEYAENMTPASSVIFRHNTQSVSAVLGAQKIIRVKVLFDGKPLDTTNGGRDVRFEKNDSVIYVSEEKIYDIVKGTPGYAEHTVELIPDSGGLDVFTLTFI